MTRKYLLKFQRPIQNKILKNLIKIQLKKMPWFFEFEELPEIFNVNFYYK